MSLKHLLRSNSVVALTHEKMNGLSLLKSRSVETLSIVYLYLSN